MDTEYTISTDAAETTTSSYTIDIKTESIPKNDHQHPTAHGNNEELTMHEMAESDYYDDVVEFYEPVNEVLDLAVQSNDEGGELSVDYQDQEVFRNFQMTFLLTYIYLKFLLHYFTLRVR